jgi:hypothetical protein
MAVGNLARIPQATAACLIEQLNGFDDLALWVDRQRWG